MAGIDAETNKDASDRSAIVGYRVILRGEDGREEVSWKALPAVTSNP